MPIATQANTGRTVVFACVCAVPNHQACFRGVELPEMVEVRRAFMQQFRKDDVWPDAADLRANAVVMF